MPPLPFEVSPLPAHLVCLCTYYFNPFVHSLVERFQVGMSTAVLARIVSDLETGLAAWASGTDHSAFASTALGGIAVAFGGVPSLVDGLKVMTAYLDHSTRDTISWFCTRLYRSMEELSELSRDSGLTIDKAFPTPMVAG